MKIIVEEVKKLLEDLSTNYVTLFFEKRSLIMLSNLLFANKFIRKLPQKISLQGVVSFLTKDNVVGRHYEIISFYYLVLYLHEVFCEGCKIAVSKGTCPTYEECMSYAKLFDKLLSDLIRTAIKDCEKESGHEIVKLNIPFIFPKNDKIVMNIPIPCLTCWKFPIVFLSLLIFLKNECSREDCLIFKIMHGEYCETIVDKNGSIKCRDLYLKGELEVDFLEKYMCNKCWSTLRNLIKS